MVYKVLVQESRLTKTQRENEIMGLRDLNDARIRQIKDFLMTNRDLDEFTVFGLYTRGNIYGCQMISTLGIDYDKRGRPFHAFYPYYLVKDEKENFDIRGVNKETIKFHKRNLFVDETTDSEYNTSFLTAKKLIKYSDEGDCSIRNVRFVTMVPFEMVTVQDIFYRMFNANIDIALDDLGILSKGFADKNINKIKEFLNNCDRYIILSEMEHIINAIGISLHLKNRYNLLEIGDDLEDKLERRKLEKVIHICPQVDGETIKPRIGIEAYKTKLGADNVLVFNSL